MEGGRTGVVRGWRIGEATSAVQHGDSRRWCRDRRTRGGAAGERERNRLTGGVVFDVRAYVGGDWLGTAAGTDHRLLCPVARGVVAVLHRAAVCGGRGEQAPGAVIDMVAEPALAEGDKPTAIPVAINPRAKPAPNRAISPSLSACFRTWAAPPNRHSS